MQHRNTFFILRSGKPRLMAAGTHCADQATPLYFQKLPQNSPTSGSRSIGIVRLRTKGHGAFLCFLFFSLKYELSLLFFALFPSRIHVN
jgi:hypothetical protein